MPQDHIGVIITQALQRIILESWTLPEKIGSVASQQIMTGIALTGILK